MIKGTQVNDNNKQKSEDPICINVDHQIIITILYWDSLYNQRIAVTNSHHTTMDPQLAALMAQNLKKQADKQGEEVVHETSGGVQKGEAPKKKYKPPPGGKLLLLSFLLFFFFFSFFL